MTRLIALAASLLLLTAGCSAAAAPTSPLHAVQTEPMLAALCDASAEAHAGRVREARVIFDDRAHEALHTLAAALQATNRTAAARLLEAKQAVEAKFAQLDPSAGPDLLELIARTADGIRAAGGALSEPCPT